MKHITKRQADAAANAIGKAFGYAEGPKVFDRGDYGGREGYYMVSWEEGPYEWPYLVHGGFDEELFSMLHPEFEPDRALAAKRSTRGPVKLPKGVVCEAVNHYSVALYTTEEY
jgi:hypothetical protein